MRQNKIRGHLTIVPTMPAGSDSVTDFPSGHTFAHCCNAANYFMTRDKWASPGQVSIYHD